MCSHPQNRLSHIFLSSWQLVHASASNFKMDLFSLLIIIGMVILLGWVGFLKRTTIRRRKFPPIDGGDMSSCWSDTVWGQERTDGNKYGPEYYSARGENCPPRYDKDMEEFFSMGEEYSYIFRNGNWFAYDMHEFDDTVAPEPVEIPSGALAA